MNASTQNLGAHAAARRPGVGNNIKIGFSKFYQWLRSKIGPLVLFITFLVGILPVPFPQFGPESISSTFFFPSPEHRLLRQPFYQGLSSIHSKLSEVLWITSDMHLDYVLIGEDLATLERQISQSQEVPYELPSRALLAYIRQLENDTSTMWQDIWDFGDHAIHVAHKTLNIINGDTRNALLRCSKSVAGKGNPTVLEASDLSQHLPPICLASEAENASTISPYLLPVWPDHLDRADDVITALLANAYILGNKLRPLQSKTNSFHIQWMYQAGTADELASLQCLTKHMFVANENLHETVLKLAEIGSQILALRKMLQQELRQPSGAPWDVQATTLTLTESELPQEYDRCIMRRQCEEARRLLPPYWRYQHEMKALGGITTMHKQGLLRHLLSKFCIRYCGCKPQSPYSDCFMALYGKS